MTRHGMMVNFGSIPTSIFPAYREVHLYFIPLEPVRTTMYGTVNYQRNKVYINPLYYKIKTINLKSEKFLINNFLVFRKSASDSTLRREFQTSLQKHFKKRKRLKGFHTRVVLPSSISQQRGVELLERLIKKHGFRNTIRLESGEKKYFAYCKLSQKDLIELRVTIDQFHTEVTFHIYIYGTDVLLKQTIRIIDEEFRKILSQ
jgi:hypothetical protein